MKDFSGCHHVWMWDSPCSTAWSLSSDGTFAAWPTLYWTWHTFTISNLLMFKTMKIPAAFHHYFSLLNLFKMLFCSHHKEHYSNRQCRLILQKLQNTSTFSRTFSRLLKKKEEIAKSHILHQRQAIELKYFGENKMVPSRRINGETFLFFYAVFLIWYNRYFLLCWNVFGYFQQHNVPHRLILHYLRTSGQKSALFTFINASETSLSSPRHFLKGSR